jgi:hypothetical protein
VTSVDLNNGKFTLESGNASNIYTTREISCFSFHTPPGNVLSALIGNGVPPGTAAGKELTGVPLGRASIGTYPFVPSLSSFNSDDCSQDSLDGDHYNEIQNWDSLQRIQTPDRCDSLCRFRRASATTPEGRQCLENSLDGERVCALHVPPSDADLFAKLCACPHACVAREPAMYQQNRRCTATTTNGEQCLARTMRASACFI